MPDIFISYSSRDREHASALFERLRASGYAVWIDESGIDAASSWSKEIASALSGCKAMLLLLSPSSLTSKNVAKELSVASELDKHILPVELERVKLSGDFLYHLSGLQRAQLSDFDGILRSLTKLGVEQNSLQIGKDVLNHPTQIDSRKSLMILPFEDLSPSGDNQWFADGLASELISALSNVKALRVMDAATTKEYKGYRGHLATYAKEMNVRYFLQGDVRKFGDSIKITSRLIDIESGDHLWQDSMKGTMNDIFDIQEKVAEKVVEGLKIHLASDEKKKLADRGTENAEAYELFMKADEYFLRQTKDGYELAVQLLTEAIKLDPGYTRAYSFKANALIALYHSFDRTPALLDEAETLCREAIRLNPDLFPIYNPLSIVYMSRGMLAEAEEAAREYIRKDPLNPGSHFSLGFFYDGTGQPAKAIAPFEEAVRLKPGELVSLWNLVVNCDAAGEQEKCSAWARVALPHFERHLKLHPKDEGKLVERAVMLLLTGRTEDAHAEAMKLTNLKDGNSLYNTACLFGRLDDRTEALRTFRKAIQAGFRDIRSLKDFLTDEIDGILMLQGTPEYEIVRQMVEKIEAELAAAEMESQKANV